MISIPQIIKAGHRLRCEELQNRESYDAAGAPRSISLRSYKESSPWPYCARPFMRKRIRPQLWSLRERSEDVGVVPSLPAMIGGRTTFLKGSSSQSLRGPLYYLRHLEGASGSIRLDCLGQGFVDFFRDKHVDVLEIFLPLGRESGRAMTPWGADISTSSGG